MTGKCELCEINNSVFFTEDVKLLNFCEDCFKGSMYLKHYWILKFITENAQKFLEYYYYHKVTHAFERETYFKKFGGNNWREKFEMCKDFKYYKDCIKSRLFQEELKNLIICSYNDLEQIIYNNEKDNVYTIQDYSDIYYTYEQFEYSLRNSGFFD